MNQRELNIRTAVEMIRNSDMFDRLGMKDQADEADVALARFIQENCWEEKESEDRWAKLRLGGLSEWEE